MMLAALYLLNDIYFSFLPFPGLKRPSGNKFRAYDTHDLPSQLCCCCCCPVVWPDLVEFRHFGKILNVVGHLLKALFTIWQGFEPTLTNILCYWTNLNWYKWPNIENSLAIWSHCCRYREQQKQQQTCGTTILPTKLFSFVCKGFHHHDAANKQAAAAVSVCICENLLYRLENCCWN